MAKRNNVWALIHNWSDDYSVGLFSTKQKALDEMAQIIKDTSDPDLSDKQVDKLVKAAQKRGLYEYSGCGEEDIQPHLQILELDIQ